MFLLTDDFNCKFEYDDIILTVDMSFDNILRLFNLFDDKTFREYDKILIALEMLIYEYDLLTEFGYSEYVDLYKYVMKKYLKIDMDKQEEDDEINKKVMDFSKDASLIYVSFLSEYGIDLFKEQGVLHWDKFSALLSNLGEKTAFKEVVGYRVMKVPSSKEASKEYIDHIRKMKEIHNLENDDETVDTMEDKLDSISSMFGK